MLSWEIRIKRAEASGKFSRDAKIKARAWPTCAVGEHVPALRSAGGAGLFFGRQRLVPLGFQELGYMFSDCVQSDNIQGARQIYERIEKLSKKKG